MINRPIGVLGGTFDPVHVGHLRLALEAYERLNLETVRLIPLSNPNHRGPPIVADQQRFEMLSRAIDGTSLIADDRELRRDGVSYTIETLESLRVDFAKQPLCLLLGADAFHGLCAWHRWQDLLGLCHLVVVTRPDSDMPLDPRLQKLVDEVRTDDPDILAQDRCGRIFFLSVPMLPISSTDIRRRLVLGKDISYLVPPSVQRFIAQNELYKGSS